ncbi:MAG: VOC family protein [Phycisphaerales bacterium]
MSSTLELGNFSVSLAVKDLDASRSFYETLGFVPVGGDAAQNWLILRNGDATIGLFQGMFEQNILTFNPGWARSGTHPDDGAFTDIRTIQAKLKEQGVALTTEADPDGSGPASFTLIDPDGNPVLVDQHR